MPPFKNFTTKAKEAIKRAHELAIERGQNHVSPLHLLTALIHQEESLVFSVLDRMDVDTMLMDYATYEAYEQYGAWTDERGKPVPCSPRYPNPALTPDEHLLYLHLTDPAWNRVRRVEQERIPLNVAAERLASLMEARRR